MTLAPGTLEPEIRRNDFKRVVEETSRYCGSAKGNLSPRGAMPLFPHCRSAIGETLSIRPVWGWGWSMSEDDVRESRTPRFDEIPLPFTMELLKPVFLGSSLVGGTGLITTPGHLYSHWHTAIYVHGDALVDLATDFAPYKLMICRGEPDIRPDPRKRAVEWCSNCLEMPRASGFANIRTVQAGSLTEAAACYRIAMFAEPADGLKAEERMQFLRRAVTLGDPEAQFALANVYYHGFWLDHQVKKEMAQAIQWYTAAAEGGHVEAQYKMGFIYLDGEGVPANRALGEKYWTQSSDLGWIYATEALDELRRGQSPSEKLRSHTRLCPFRHKRIVCLAQPEEDLLRQLRARVAAVGSEQSTIG